jgi:hypothetical protein
LKASHGQSCTGIEVQQWLGKAANTKIVIGGMRHLVSATAGVDEAERMSVWIRYQNDVEVVDEMTYFEVRLFVDGKVKK